MASKTFLQFYEEYWKAIPITPDAVIPFLQKAVEEGHQNAKHVLRYVNEESKAYYAEGDTLYNCIKHFDTDVIHGIKVDPTQPDAPWPITDALIDVQLKDGTKFKGFVRRVGTGYYVCCPETHVAYPMKNLELYRYVWE